MRRRAERPGPRAFTLVEMVAVLVVVGVAAGVVLPRLPGVSGLGLHEAGARLVERLCTARERAILDGRAVRIDLRDTLPHGVSLERLDAGGTPASASTIEFAPDGDALPRRATLVDDAGGRVQVIVPSGFGRARLVGEVSP